MPEDILIGRGTDRAWLEDAARSAAAGRGGLVLLAGEAGVGKTRLAEAALRGSGVDVLRGAATATATPPYGPVVAALRSHLRSRPAALRSCGPLRAHLAMLLPELGRATAQSDRATLFEAIRCAFETIARAEPAAVLLDDLQWSDEATLELLAALAAPLRELPLLVVGAYRTDELPRDHPLRRLRADLRRARILRELQVGPLDEAASTALAEQVLGEPVSPRLAAVLHDRTQGVPFFVEELAEALRCGGRLVAGDSGLELTGDAELPVPDTIRDAVLLRTAGLSEAGRNAAEAASVAGAEFAVELVAALGCEPGLAELLRTGLVEEREGGRAAFRHALARGAIYESVPWLRRRSLHRRLAEQLEASGAPSTEIAVHKLAAGDRESAVEALLAAAADLAAVHAYRDAARAGHRALELWTDGERPDERLGALERYARWAELAGELAEATRALREAVAGLAGAPAAPLQRRLAGLYELQGDRGRALAARRIAADAFAAAGEAGEAAAERLATAGYLQSAGKHSEAVELATVAGEEAVRADRVDLRARALGLRGVALAKRGEFDTGAETVRAALSLALEHELTVEAAELYQRLGTVLETAADYGGAQQALASAVGLCEAGGAAEHVCLSCMAYVLRELGEWDQAAELCEELEAGSGPPDTTLVVDGILGAIHALRGDERRARPLLLRCLASATRLDVVSMTVDSAAALAWLDAEAGEPETAAGHHRFVLERWQRSEDHHYAVPPLRVAACFFAEHGDLARARACAEALSSIAASAGHADALAALAHALGETALAEGDTDAAAAQLERALELHATLEIPFERAHVELRAGVALAAAGRTETAIERLADAHRRARRLRARPLASSAAAELARLGASLSEILGARAAAEHATGGLSRRELEVMRLVAAGRTNREIARELFLSSRTVDMHVRNILAKLRCRSRTEATARAGALGLLAPR
jgi:DNA-binding NarL/FixJ family response regulator